MHCSDILKKPPPAIHKSLEVQYVLRPLQFHQDSRLQYITLLVHTKYKYELWACQAARFPRLGTNHKAIPFFKQMLLTVWPTMYIQQLRNHWSRGYWKDEGMAGHSKPCPHNEDADTPKGLAKAWPKPSESQSTRRNI